MIVLDTNLLLRYLLNDDAAQGRRVARLLDSAPQVTVTHTIVLELVWVLECSDCSRAEIAVALRHVLGLPNMRLPNESALYRAVQWFEQGLDFADALHLGLSPATATLMTFDKDFVSKAKRAEAFPPVALCPTR
ncbi:type II toxin-antitoxin system VapC family toxin [Sulfuritalea sp.]|uniref:type II toxin-antitoxin system VapC family toxin n=1 Tax=Sulfuritalea sp. TaxID=2480090 RepID=UPI001ACF0DB6|nr:type II toxin-antitoxin system VapC family toxin [Sulfuritalea sp.]MBN8475171.1 type II toxin-antitoxin system VapC family toxin [Sulfuritalea sp.]